MTDEWITKNVLYIYTMVFCLAFVRKEILSFVTAWMDLEDAVLSGISQTQRDKYCMMSLIYRI